MAVEVIIESPAPGTPVVYPFLVTGHAYQNGFGVPALVQIYNQATMEYLGVTTAAADGFFSLWVTGAVAVLRAGSATPSAVASGSGRRSALVEGKIAAWARRSGRVLANQSALVRRSAKSAANKILSLRRAGTTTANEVIDLTAPTVTFVMPASYSGLTVPITQLTANETGCTFYVTEDNTYPANKTRTPTMNIPAGDITAGATVTITGNTPAGPTFGAAPSNYVFGSTGSKTLYAYAKDTAGNVSNVATQTTVVS